LLVGIFARAKVIKGYKRLSVFVLLLNNMIINNF
jgi:hypothetical protein